MRNKRRMLLTAVVALLVVLACSGTAQAYTTYNGHVLNGGVGNYGANPRYYYITFSAGLHEDDITSAIDTWIHTTSRLGITTPIYWARTYTQSQSVMDFYHNVYFDVSSGIIATTEQILNNVVINPYSSQLGMGQDQAQHPCVRPPQQLQRGGELRARDRPSHGSWAHDRHQQGHVPARLGPDRQRLPGRRCKRHQLPVLGGRS